MPSNISLIAAVSMCSGFTQSSKEQVSYQGQRRGEETPGVWGSLWGFKLRREKGFMTKKIKN